MSKKPIIVFEGIEGSGKSYHLTSVARYLKQKKISFIKIREPGGSQNSEKIRRLMLNNKSNFNKNTDLLLFLSSRSENISLIKKNYNKKIILIDRFTDSTIAYQHFGMGVDINLIETLNKFLLKDTILDDKSIIKSYKRVSSFYDYTFGQVFRPGQKKLVSMMKCSDQDQVLEIGIEPA